MTLQIGSPCPTFDLPGTDGANHSLASFAAAKVLVVIVSCNHCPYVVAYEERMAKLSRDYGSKGVQVVAINANDTLRYPDDGMAQMKARVKERHFDFPYLRDDPQSTARALGARFTPEVFVFDAARALRYHGRIDDQQPDRIQHQHGAAQEENRRPRMRLHCLITIIIGRARPGRQAECERGARSLHGAGGQGGRVLIRAASPATTAECAVETL